MDIYQKIRTYYQHANMLTKKKHFCKTNTEYKKFISIHHIYVNNFSDLNYTSLFSDIMYILTNKNYEDILVLKICYLVL